MLKQSYFKQFSLAKVHSLVLFDPYQMLPLQARVDLEVLAMEGYSTIPKPSRITRISPSDCLVSYLGYLLGVESYLCAEKLSVYSTVPADWATFNPEIFESYKLVLYKSCTGDNTAEDKKKMATNKPRKMSRKEWSVSRKEYKIK